MEEYQPKIDLELKVKLLKEYLDNGGVEKIPSQNLRESIRAIEFDEEGKVLPETLNSSVKAAMSALLACQITAPYYSSEHKSEYQTLLQKSLFFDQINITTEAEVDELFERLEKKEKCLFRGVREARWRLYSSLQRDWLDKKLFEKEKSYDQLLKEIVELGEDKYADEIEKLLKENFDAKSINNISVLSYLQHHNCPTPLLDWTFNFKKALYFGLDGLKAKVDQREIGDYFSLYYIDEEHLKGANFKLIIKESLDITLEKLTSEGKSIKKDDLDLNNMVDFMVKSERLVKGFPIGYFSDKDGDIEFYFSLENSENIKNQEGVFTWNASSSKPLEQMGNEFYEENFGEAENYRFCECFNIHKKLFDYVKAKIEADGINKELIYTDESNKAKEVFEEIIRV